MAKPAQNYRHDQPLKKLQKHLPKNAWVSRATVATLDQRHVEV